MTHSHILSRTILAIASCALTLQATAHEVWIEDTPEGHLYVRFAEYGDDLEKSPGALDALTPPFAWKDAAAPVASEESAPGGEAPARVREAIAAGRVSTIPAQKKSDGYLLEGASARNATQLETGFTVMGKPGDAEKPARKPFFYARWHTAESGAAKPALNFDLVPTGENGKVCVYFRGKPLAGVKVTLYPPAEPEVELVSDERGVVSFTTKKPGLYMMAAAHQRESIPGFFGGKQYDAVSHNCSLSWRQP